MRYFWLFSAIMFVLAGCRSSAPPAVEVVSARVVPFINPEGKQLQMICVDWKNSGKTPIRGVKAKLVAYDAAGTTIYTINDYYIYATGDSEPGVAEGSVYNEPDDQGNIIMPESAPTAPAVRAEATIIEVLEKGNGPAM